MQLGCCQHEKKKKERQTKLYVTVGFAETGGGWLEWKYKKSNVIDISSEQSPHGTN